MTAERRFRPEELAPDGTDEPEAPAAPELAETLGVARELEWLAAGADIRPAADFSARVMAAIAAEPLPAPVRAATLAVRARRPRAVLAAFGDLWRVAWSGSRPLAVRAQALAIVLVILALGTSATGLGALGAWHALTPDGTPFAPAGSSGVTETPSPTPAPTVTLAPLGPLGPLGPVEAPTPGLDTPEPTDAPTATPPPATTRPALHPTPTPTPTPTASPTASPDETGEPSESPQSSESDQGGRGGPGRGGGE